MLTMSTELTSGIGILRLSGTLDRGESSAALISAVKKLLDDGRPIVLCDCSAVTIIDSTGLSALVSCHDLAHQAAGRFAIVQPSSKVRAVLQVTRLIGILAVFDDEPSALATLRPSR
jgi:anti-sigma B factor antagonist